MKKNMVRESFLQTVKKNKKLTILLLIAIVGVVLASLIPPQILKRVIDQNLIPQNKNGLLHLAVLYFIVVLSIGIFDFVKEAAITILGQRITKAIRMNMMEKLERINMGFFTANASGVIVSRFTNDVESISSMFTNGIVGMIVDCFKIIGIIISVWLFHVNLGILTLFLLPVIYGITRSFQKSMLKAQIENRIIVSKVNNHIGESIKNMIMIKAFSKEPYMENRYKEYLLDNYKTIEKVNFYDAVFSPIIQILRAVVIAVIAILASRQLHLLGISIGMVAASIELISNLFAPIEELGMELQNIQQAVSGIYRVNSFFDEQEDGHKQKEYRTDTMMSNPGEVSLAFHNLSFHYEEGKDVLKDLDIQINPYEKVTFIGRTGVGKSTLFKLILGLLKPTNGSITINGIDVYSIPNTEKRKLFGYVEQNFHMVKGTVADQISLQDETITIDQIKNALQYVGMLAYVEALENGCDTVVTNEGLFSQGQKQLLSIARAIVTNPPILLFDEITANLDSLTEEKIVNVLKEISDTHMILSISHRISSMVTSDQVIILEDGRIKNMGTPEYLLQNDDWFKNRMALENLTWD